jgi:hypothetical protein
VRRGRDKRAICGLLVSGFQPALSAKTTCFACLKKCRAVVRVPALPMATAPVSVGAKASSVHLATRAAPPFFVAKESLCGRKVAALVAVGPLGVTCERCLSLAKASA